MARFADVATTAVATSIPLSGTTYPFTRFTNYILIVLTIFASMISAISRVARSLSRRRLIQTRRENVTF